MSWLLAGGMLLINLPLLFSPVWGQDATHQLRSHIIEEVMGKLDELKVNIRKEIEDELKEEMKLKVEEVKEMKLEIAALKVRDVDLTAKMTTLESSLPSLVSAAVRDVPYLMFAAYQVSQCHFVTGIISLFQSAWSSVGTVSYEYFMAEYNNGHRPNGGNGTLDLDTGVFRTPRHLATLL